MFKKIFLLLFFPLIIFPSAQQLEQPFNLDEMMEEAAKMGPYHGSRLHMVCGKNILDEVAAVKEIEKSNDLREVDCIGETALHALSTNISFVDFKRKNRTVLSEIEHEEEDKKKARVALKMLEKDPGLVNLKKEGTGALSFAMQSSLPFLSKLLVKKDADLHDEANGFSVLGLQAGSFYQHPIGKKSAKEMIPFLLAHGADVNRSGSSRDPIADPFRFAINIDSRELQQTLLFYGLRNLAKYISRGSDNRLQIPIVFRPYIALKSRISDEEKECDQLPIFYSQFDDAFIKFQDGDRSELPSLIFGMTMLSRKFNNSFFTDIVFGFINDRVKPSESRGFNRGQLEVEFFASLPRTVEEVGRASNLAKILVNRDLTTEERFLFRERLHVIDEQQRHRAWTPKELEASPLRVKDKNCCLQ